MKDPELNVDACRRATPYSSREYIGRILWSLAFPLFRLSPRPFFAWRRLLLRVFGATVGKDSNIYPSARIYLPWNLTIGKQASIGEWVLIYNLGPVSIGDRATVSHRAHLCAGTHDYRDSEMPLLRLPVDVGADAWVCADAFVGPGCRIGNGAVVGAAAVVTRDVSPWTVVAGNPAREIARRLLHVAKC